MKKREIETYAAPHQHKCILSPLELVALTYPTREYTYSGSHMNENKTKKKNGLNEHKHDVIKHFTEFSVVYLFVICLIKLFACVCCYVALQNVIFLLYLTFSFFFDIYIPNHYCMFKRNKKEVWKIFHIILFYLYHITLKYFTFHITY